MHLFLEKCVFKYRVNQQKIRALPPKRRLTKFYVMGLLINAAV